MHEYIKCFHSRSQPPNSCHEPVVTPNLPGNSEHCEPNGTVWHGSPRALWSEIILWKTCTKSVVWTMPLLLRDCSWNLQKKIRLTNHEKHIENYKTWTKQTRFGHLQSHFVSRLRMKPAIVTADEWVLTISRTTILFTNRAWEVQTLQGLTMPWDLAEPIQQAEPREINACFISLFVVFEILQALACLPKVTFTMMTIDFRKQQW